MAYLQDSTNRKVAIGEDGITLGRDGFNDVTLRNDLSVSRSHAKVVPRDGQWVLIDLGSKNGTFVNARRVERHPLRDLDRIQIGDSTWTFHAGIDPFATEAAVDPHRLAPTTNLTSREREVLRLVSNGLTDKDIAKELDISVNTIRSHLDRIGKKTGLRKRSELTRLAIGLQLESEP